MYLSGMVSYTPKVSLTRWLDRRHIIFYENGRGEHLDMTVHGPARVVGDDGPDTHDWDPAVFYRQQFVLSLSLPPRALFLCLSRVKNTMILSPLPNRSQATPTPPSKFRGAGLSTGEDNGKGGGTYNAVVTSTFLICGPHSALACGRGMWWIDLSVVNFRSSYSLSVSLRVSPPVSLGS